MAREAAGKAFSSLLERLFLQGSQRAIQVVKESVIFCGTARTDAKVELLGMWREILQAVSTQLGEKSLQDVVVTTCGYLWGQPHDLAEATESHALSDAIFSLLALALRVNEDAVFLTEQDLVLCCQAIWVALSYKGFAEHLEKVYSALCSLVKAHGDASMKCLRLALLKPTTPCAIHSSAQAVVETLYEASHTYNRKRFRTAAKSLQRLS